MSTLSTLQRGSGPQQSETIRLREAVQVGDASGPSIPAEEVYAELRQIIADCRAAER